MVLPDRYSITTPRLRKLIFQFEGMRKRIYDYPVYGKSQRLKLLVKCCIAHIIKKGLFFKLQSLAISKFLPIELTSNI